MDIRSVSLRIFVDKTTRLDMPRRSADPVPESIPIDWVDVLMVGMPVLYQGRDPSLVPLLTLPSSRGVEGSWQ
jgi:hypothetical protein